MYIFQDFKANKGNTKGKIVMLFLRLAQRSDENIFYRFILLPYRCFYKIFFEWILGFEVPFKVKIGKGLKIYHLQAIVINANTIIGENCSIRQSLTIGNKGNGGGSPVIGDNVNIGAQVCIIGDIKIGHNVNIGAGSVVVKDIPSNCTVVGNPAKIVKQW